MKARGYAAVTKIVLSRGLEIDNLRFSMNIAKEVNTIPAHDSGILNSLKESIRRILPDLKKGDSRLDDQSIKAILDELSKIDDLSDRIKTIQAMAKKDKDEL